MSVLGEIVTPLKRGKKMNEKEARELIRKIGVIMEWYDERVDGEYGISPGIAFDLLTELEKENGKK